MIRPAEPPEGRPPGPAELARLLRAHEAVVAAIVRSEAGVTLLRFDSVEDLVQGTLHEAVRSAESLEWRGEAAFVSWLCTIARRHLGSRRDYWFAGKRFHGNLLRLTLSGSAASPAGSRPGPATFAFRREQLVLARKAVALLMDRDQKLVTWAAEGVSASEMATRLGISPDAAEKARERALDRLRKAFDLLRPRDAGPGSRDA